MKKKKKTNLGEKCATWNCNGKIVRVKNPILKDVSAECNKCGRGYWIIER